MEFQSQVLAKSRQTHINRLRYIQNPCNKHMYLGTFKIPVQTNLFFLFYAHKSCFLVVWLGVLSYRLRLTDSDHQSLNHNNVPLHLIITLTNLKFLLANFLGTYKLHLHYSIVHTILLSTHCFPRIGSNVDSAQSNIKIHRAFD